MKTKICSKCKKEKSISEFYKDRRHSDNLTSQCKKCASKYNKEYHLRDKVKKHHKKYMRQYRIKNYYRTWVLGVLNNHKARGYEISLINKKELMNLAKQTIYCPICSCKLSWKYRKGTNDNSPTLDRINNEKNLDKDNIWIICHKCNRTKSNRTMKEFVEYCANISNKFSMKYFM